MRAKGDIYVVLAYVPSSTERTCYDGELVSPALPGTIRYRTRDQAEPTGKGASKSTTSSTL